MSRIFKHYGLEGQVIKVKRVGGATVAYPWAYTEQELRVVRETPERLHCIVMRHKNPKGLFKSHEYPTYIDKYDIEKGKFIINGGEIK